MIGNQKKPTPKSFCILLFSYEDQYFESIATISPGQNKEADRAIL